MLCDSHILRDAAPRNFVGDSEPLQGLVEPGYEVAKKIMQ